MLDWRELHHLSGSVTEQQMNDLQSKHSRVFKDDLGLIKHTTAKMLNPVFVIFVEHKLDHLQNSGVIEPILCLKAALVVPVVKLNGRVICGDFKFTVNKVAKLDIYPLPKIDDLFSQLASGKFHKT